MKKFVFLAFLSMVLMACASSRTENAEKACKPSKDSAVVCVSNAGSETSGAKVYGSAQTSVNVKK